MTRYKAIISYDGHDFAGFQRQPHARSVQEEIEKTLTKINRGKPVIVHGAGRTDSGVHALGQVIHFNLPQKRDEEKLRFALDTQTPEDIDFISVEEVNEDFHSRYCKHSKTYEFIVDIGRPKNPMMRHYATHNPYPLDRTITKAYLDFDEKRNFLIFTFSGNGFLYKQIRNMVGTLLKIGNKRMPVEQIDRILTEKNRHLAGPTAAPNGLYLKEIRYEE